MFKKALILLLCGMMLSAALPFAVHAEVEKAVYVCDGGKGDGLTRETPCGSLLLAYKKLGKEGGRIVLVGTCTLTANFTELAHTGTVTITQFWDDLDTRSTASLASEGTGKIFYINGPTVFENIRITTQSKSGLLIVAQYHPVEFGEGVSVEGFAFNQVTDSLTLCGGLNGSATPASVVPHDAHITVKSGDVYLVGGNRQKATENEGTTTIDVYGGTVRKFYGGSINGGSIDKTTVNLYGGTFTGILNLGYGTNNLEASVYGGKFDAVSSIQGEAASSSRVTVDSKAKDTVLPLLTGFRETVTDDGTVKKYYTAFIAEEVFGSGSFTDSKGTTIPYRCYYPEGYDRNGAASYPVFFYFHGNGSRGNDNKAQISSNNALVGKVLNSGTPCIIVAAQCPAESSWLPKADATTLDPSVNDESKYLLAAEELMNKIIAEEKIDTTRIYLGGGSNGAAACWKLIARSPKTVAGAIIQAGLATAANATKLAEYYVNTPIWTFHGDADTMVSVDGTRAMVAAIQKAGGTKLRYTEMPGYNHNIWADSAATPGLFEWLFAQTRTDSVGVFRVGLTEKDLTAADLKAAKEAPVTTAPSTETTALTTAEPAATSDDYTQPPAESNGNVLPILLAVGAAAVAATAVLLIKKKHK